MKGHFTEHIMKYMLMKRPAGNTGFASGGETYKLGTLCFYSSSVLVDPEYSGCSETRTNAKPETVTSKHNMTQYTYLSSIDYINNLTFDYVETYSFQRGTEFEESNKINRPEYERLKVRKDKRNDLTVQEEKRFLELNDLYGFTQYLINDKGQFHPSSIKTHTFKSTDSQIDRLKNILRTEIKDIPAWMCAPIYRDAIVFYDKLNRIVSTLNICLSCEYMETKMFSQINGDNKTYDLLRQYFIDLGHKIEDR